MIFIENPLHKKIKYQSWYSTLCCGLEVQKPTHSLQSVNGPSNTFDWIPKWARTVLSLIYCSWDIHRDPLHKENSNIKVDIWHPAVGLRCKHPPRHFSQVNTQTMPLTVTPSCQELCVLNIFFMGIFIETPLEKKIQISRLIFDTLLWTWGVDAHSGISVS